VIPRLSLAVVRASVRPITPWFLWLVGRRFRDGKDVEELAIADAPETQRAICTCRQDLLLTVLVPNLFLAPETGSEYTHARHELGVPEAVGIDFEGVRIVADANFFVAVRREKSLTRGR
jgi:hypothetical protein